MWRNEVSARQLREMLPDVALRMETESIRQDLSNLGIVFIYRRTPKSAAFEIQMSPNHIMRIEPTDRANNSVSEWFTWHHQNHGDQMRITTSMRCFVSIKKINGSDEDNYSLTIHENSIEAVMRCAIHNYKHSRGVDLNPTSRSILRKRTK
jgi:hypothetical protein